GGDAGKSDGSVPPNPTDLCAGLVQDLMPHAMTALAKPGVGQVATDAEFGTKIRRITQVATGSANPAVVPLSTTVPAWNADGSRLLLLDVAAGRHELYDGKTYAFVRALDDISPADVEQVYWHTSDPDVFFYVDGKTFVRYHVGAATKEVLTTFA